MAEDREGNTRISRRTAIRRGAIVGAGVWVVPAVSSMRLPAHGQVGSPSPEPSPTATPPEPTTTPTPEVSPTATVTTTPPQPSTSPTTQVGGVKIVQPTDVSGTGLAKTGQDLTTQAVAGAGLVVLGAGLQKIAGKRLAEQSVDDPTAS
jgi:hypothetical protein